MKLSDVIDRARNHLAGGWHEPLSLASDGTICDRQAEGIERFCVHDALLTAARGDVDSFRAAEDLVQRLLDLSLQTHTVSVNEWAGNPKRTHAEVLQLFSKAHKHALTREQR